jgi:hypothetical protein
MKMINKLECLSPPPKFTQPCLIFVKKNGNLCMLNRLVWDKRSSLFWHFDSLSEGARGTIRSHLVCGQISLINISLHSKQNVSEH